MADRRDSVSGRFLGSPCPLCGFPDSLFQDINSPRYYCDACFFEGTAVELIERLQDQARRWWSSESELIREILAAPQPVATTLRRAASTLFSAGFPANAVVTLLRAANSGFEAAVRCNPGELEAIAIEAATAVAEYRSRQPKEPAG